ncbi:glycosyltransferase family 4 protein [Erwinia sp. INIA-01]|uniref:glycosyltransferase family 4 protein n=1 Tax=Erwinia sp. INIA01 TaxID=2991500 RepID=UPI0022241138|nr:glycosyltransferase family 4 protein [Erwinia sp. INIA01]MCW1874156.1 glycosyltransferase family 4 protein [Erwinia sp. INIA01]
MLKNAVYIYTKHQGQGASSRYRSIQYFDYLQQQGVTVVHRYLFSDEYLKLKYSKNRKHLLVAMTCYLKRFFNLVCDVRKGRVFIIEKELFPYLPVKFEYLIKAVGARYILDYDDAIWHNYDSHRRGLVRFLLGNKLKKIIRTSDFFIGGNDYLCDYADRAGARHVVTIPTVISQKKYHAAYLDMPKSEPFTLVWIGSPSTSPYLVELNDALSRITQEFDINVRLIGFDEKMSHRLAFRHTVVSWNADTEVSELATAHLGIMPLPDRPFEKGKCGFKLIQYMAVGLPILASPVGVNVQIVTNGVNGFTCRDSDDWYSRIRQIFLDETLRAEMGKNSRKNFIERYSLEAASIIYLQTIEQVCAGE